MSEQAPLRHSADRMLAPLKIGCPMPGDTKTSEYAQGYAAFAVDRDCADDPFSSDSACHLALENGWFQVFDDHAEAVKQ